MTSSQKRKDGIDTTRTSGVKDNPFVKNQSMETQYVKKRRKSRGLNAIGRGRISSILSRWNQQPNDNYKPQKSAQKSKPKEVTNKKPKTQVIVSQPIVTESKQEQKQNIPSNYNPNKNKSNEIKPSASMNKNSKVLTETTEQLERLKSKLLKDKQNNISLKTENDLLLKELKELEQTQNTLNNTNKILNKNVNTLSKSLSAMETDVLMIKKQQQHMNNQGNDTILQLKEEISKLENNLLSVSDSHQNISVTETESFINGLKDKINENENEINRLNNWKDNEINKWDSDNKNKSNETNECIEKIENMKLEIEKQKKKSNNLQQTLLEKEENETREIEQYNQQIETLTNDKNNKINELNDNIITITKQLNEYNIEMNELKQNNNTLNNKNEQLIIKNMALTDKNCDIKIKELLIKIETLENENKQLIIQHENKMEQVQIEDDYIPNNEQNNEQINEEFSPEIVVQNSVTDEPEIEYKQQEPEEDIVVQNAITDEPGQEEQEEYIDVENDNNNEPMEPVKSSDEFIDVKNENSNENSDENEYEFESIEKKEGWMEQQTNVSQKWEKKYIRIEHKYLCVYKNENCNEFECNKIDLTNIELIYSFDNETQFSLQNNANENDINTFKCKDESETDKWMTWITEIEAAISTNEENEFVSIDEKNDEFVNVSNVYEKKEEEKKEEVKVVKKKKKVHKLAMGLNIPMGGLLGGMPPSLLKKKQAREQPLPQQEFEKPMIPANVRSPKKRENIESKYNEEFQLGNDVDDT